VKKLAWLTPVPIALAACEPPPPTSASGAPEPAIASVYRSRCGACHVRVGPNTRSRYQLEDAFSRHRRRLRLRDEQWEELVAYLAIPEAPAPPPAAPPPCVSTPPSAPERSVDTPSSDVREP
jgi:hypothetical protein